MTLIHLVIIEESEDDVGLLLQELRRGGYEPAFQQVRTSAELTTALDQQAWDAVFSDYSGSHLTAEH